MPTLHPRNAATQRPKETISRADVYTRITDQIIKAIEAGAQTCTMPWHAPDIALAIPRNAMTQKAYRGVNIVALLAEAQAHHYPEAKWATYRQWSDLGYQVNKGEKSACAVFWKPLDIDATGKSESDHVTEDADTPQSRWVARAFALFNIAQTANYEPPVTQPPRPGHERIAEIEHFIKALGPDIRHGGNRAFYRPATDHIQMPPFNCFVDPFSYYSTLTHEVTHWTGHTSRLNRELKTRFGTESYAAEELIAELGSAFLCADLGLSSESRPENAAYIDNWLTVLKRDTRAIFAAASYAQRAVDFMHDLRGAAPQPEVTAVVSRSIQQSLCL
ncbi:hypothetical protein CCAX7_46260 [Capsulimonas corticalis]|uniref:Uncharacterized protein n=1 Tax=Capsulimonas corticalis TaxID=2219043 RepID=A0A402D517_9BACT|nr:zincin-like metallopeptidase domain-containing protein [Capsulimonas corticalis]BDI32575.1 hypothetical protein CCAX7_46260 [Capsulimonas corticalis]